MKLLPVYLAGLVLFLAACSPGDAGDEALDYADTSFAGSEPWILQIGVLDGNEAEIFGRIRDVLVDDFGNVYILDDQAFTLS